MKQSWIKRLDHLEGRRTVWRRPVEALSPMETARRVAFVVALGGEAKEELDAAGASLDPVRRAELTKTLETARSIVAALANETPPSARAIIPGSLDALLAAVI